MVGRCGTTMWDDGSTAAVRCAPPVSLLPLPLRFDRQTFVSSIRCAPSISIFDFNDSITAAGAAVEIRTRQFSILRLFTLSLFIAQWYNMSVSEEA